jgi:hypothetical protein
LADRNRVGAMTTKAIVSLKLRVEYKRTRNFIKLFGGFETSLIRGRAIPLSEFGRT